MATAAALDGPKPPGRLDDQPEEHRKLVERIRKRFEAMEGVHKQYRDKWDYLDGLYHNFDDLRHRWRAARQESDRDRGVVLLDSLREWGGYLLIPYAFATIETVVPKIASNRPRIAARPLDPAAVEHLKTNEDLVNQQQADINYEVKLQPTVRRALKLGLGVQHLFWERKVRKVRQPVQGSDGSWYAPEPSEVVLREGPQVEDVDIYDWFWDDAAKSIETCEDILYRTWRSFSYVARKVEEGEWLPLDLDAVKRMGRSEGRDAIWSARREMQGISKSNVNSEEDGLHEVWQYHRGDRIVTVLDRELIVANDVTPFYHREFPFQIYRPTLVEGQIPGKSEIEPMEHLIAELSTLRTQRRDSATIALNPPTFYAQGFINRKNMKLGPGVWIPTQGDPREAIHQPQLQPIPASGYQEEQQLKSDIEFTSGISDAVRGGSTISETATGAQIEMQTANARISLKARMLLLEVIKPGAAQWQWLNRQNLIDTEGTPRTIRVDDPNHPDGYRFVDITPEALMAQIELVPEEGSTEPENKVQRMNDALTLNNTMKDEEIIDPIKRVQHVLNEAGVDNPESWIRQTEVSAAAFAEATKRALMVNGMDEFEAQEAVLRIAQEAQMVNEEMARGEMEEEPSQNGAAPPEPVNA